MECNSRTRRFALGARGVPARPGASPPQLACSSARRTHCPTRSGPETDPGGRDGRAPEGPRRPRRPRPELNCSLGRGWGLAEVFDTAALRVRGLNPSALRAPPLRAGRRPWGGSGCSGRSGRWLVPPPSRAVTAREPPPPRGEEPLAPTGTCGCWGYQGAARKRGARSLGSQRDALCAHLTNQRSVEERCPCPQSRTSA